MVENNKSRSNHPGSSEKKALFFAKGRLLLAEDLQAVQKIIGQGPYERHMLIEYLHAIQDYEGHLSEGYMQALADKMRLPMAEVYEVATFYAHFDVVADGEPPPPPITIRICDSISCMLKNSNQLLQSLESKAQKNIRILRAPCMGRCDTAPVCEIGHRHVDNATPETIQEVLDQKNFRPEIPKYQDLTAYLHNGGYEVLKACINGERLIGEVIDELSNSDLKGLGGAGFPTGKKWSYVRAEAKPRLMAVNADEGEPGTFKDRYYLETNPHSFLEGMLIGAWAIEAQTVFIYLRDEYPAVREILLKEIAALERAGLATHTKIQLKRGAGAYICGEESAMIESIEGKRGLPRHRPPYVAQVGIFGRPTLVNNVETLYWIPKIIEQGAAWFSSQGDGKGLRSYSVSGQVKEPGVKLCPAGTTALELIELSGGMLDGHSFKGYLPGGASGGILPANKGNLALDFGQLEKYGCLVGSHAVVIFSDQDDPKAIALNLMKFFEDESCGQCTPCRSGTEKAARLMEKKTWDILALKDLATVMADASICGLGQAAPNPLLSVLKYFPENIE
jgi:NADH:ubiquinone oxidoreductase subunit F (NADH-binding)/NADH:ubiquinone oxidoreductase subunit E